MAINKQPFYHGAHILFTSTTGCSEQEVLEALNKFAVSEEGQKLGLVEDSVEIEAWLEPEPGDPADLL